MRKRQILPDNVFDGQPGSGVSFADKGMEGESGFLKHFPSDYPMTDVG